MKFPKKNDILYYANYNVPEDIFGLCKIKVTDTFPDRAKASSISIQVSYEVLEWYYAESVEKGKGEYFYSGQSEFYTSKSGIDEYHYFSSKENFLKWILK